MPQPDGAPPGLHVRVALQSLLELQVTAPSAPTPPSAGQLIALDTTDQAPPEQVAVLLQPYVHWSPAGPQGAPGVGSEPGHPAGFPVSGPPSEDPIVLAVPEHAAAVASRAMATAVSRNEGRRMRSA